MPDTTNTDDAALVSLADDLTPTVRDAVPAPSDDRVVIFTIHERLGPSTLEVLADHGATVSPTGMIEYTHTKQTKIGSDDPLEATFTAKLD